MKRTLISVVIIISIFSCKVQEIEQNTINGEFYKLFKNRDFSYAYTLKLNADHTFKFVLRIETCMGKWELINDSIILNCNEEPIESRISSGYMFQREHELQIISRNRLKYNDIILRRKK
jgi:hypothetical protein